MQEHKNILKGPNESIEDFKTLSLGELLFNQLIVHRQRVAQVNAYTGYEQTFEEILNASRKLSIYLNKAGATVDDRIAICSENNVEFCIPVCAALYLGLTVCPLSPLYSERELKHALSISRPKYIFVSSIAAKRLQNLLKELFWLPQLIILNDSNAITVPSIEALTSNIEANEICKFKPTKVDINNHVAAILCSSGTTGLPKGVMLTDRNFLTVVKQLIDSSVEFLNQNTTTLGLLPYFHAYSYTVLIFKLIMGSKSIVLSRFDEKLFLHTIEKYKIEHLTVVPPLMVFLAKHPLVERYDLSSVKTIWCGAASLSEEIQKSVMKRLNVANIRQGYGLTESTLAVLRTPNNNRKPGSVGVLAPGISGKVISIGETASDEPLGPGCIGELCFKGKLIMKGYCDDKDSTAATIDKDSWLHTGDVGYYDEEGYFYIVDRLKELIKYKGYQVPPAELEGILLSYPGIKDAAVIGVPNEEAGELPMAFVVKQDGHSVTEDEIMKYVNERVSTYKRLRGGIRFIESIPKTPSGKILRRMLRDTVKSKL